MKKKTISTLITVFIILILASLILWSFFKKPQNSTTEELTKCIGENSILYVQLGCTHCETQEEMFGENYKYLNVVDCVYEEEKCINAGIKATPTWIIKNKVYEGFQTKDKLKEITGC